MSQPIIIGGVIYHHGIFGQKWGKQNGPPYPLSGDVSTGKKLKTLKRVNNVYKADRQEKYVYERHRIKKGTKMYRTTTAKDEKNEGSIYVSYQNADRGKYKMWVKQGADRDGKATYEKTFKLIENLIVPSNEDVKESFEKVLKKNSCKDIDEAIKKFIIGDRVLNQNISEAKKDYEKVNSLIKRAKKSADNDLKMRYDNADSNKIIMFNLTTGKIYGEISMKEYTNGIAYKRTENVCNNIMDKIKNKEITYYEAGMASLTKNDKFRNEMIKDLSSKGFNTMVDVAGAGIMPINNKEANREDFEPLIIFDRSKSMKEVSTKSVSLNDARSSYELANIYTKYMKNRRRIDS